MRWLLVPISVSLPALMDSLKLAALNLIWIGYLLDFSKNTKGLPWAKVARSRFAPFLHSAVTAQSERPLSTVSLVSTP